VTRIQRVYEPWAVRARGDIASTRIVGIVTEAAVTDNAAEERYELASNGSLLGVIEYRDRPDARVLVHTEVDPEHEGEGLGSRLVEGALQDMRERNLELIPLCPFVRAYLRSHPDQADLVAPRAV
jgi:uncharacterized protein